MNAVTAAIPGDSVALPTDSPAAIPMSMDDMIIMNSNT